MKLPPIVSEKEELEIAEFGKIDIPQDSKSNNRGTTITPNLEICRVDLDSIIKFESKKQIQKNKEVENGKEDGGRSPDREYRGTPALPRKERRKWWDTIY